MLRALYSTSRRVVSYWSQLVQSRWLLLCVMCCRSSCVNNSVILSMHLCLRLSGAVVEPSQRRTALITGRSSLTGGSQSGRLQQSSHPRALSSITLLIVPKIQRVEYSHASSQSGHKHCSPLILIQAGVM